MKLTTARLKQLIKEELSNVMTEAQGIEGLYNLKKSIEGKLDELESMGQSDMHLEDQLAATIEQINAHPEKAEHEEFLAQNKHMDALDDMQRTQGSGKFQRR